MEAITCDQGCPDRELWEQISVFMEWMSATHAPSWSLSAIVPISSGGLCLEVWKQMLQALLAVKFCLSPLKLHSGKCMNKNYSILPGSILQYFGTNAMGQIFTSLEQMCSFRIRLLYTWYYKRVTWLTSACQKTCKNLTMFESLLLWN